MKRHSENSLSTVEMQVPSSQLLPGEQFSEAFHRPPESVRGTGLIEVPVIRQPLLKFPQIPCSDVIQAF